MSVFTEISVRRQALIVAGLGDLDRRVAERALRGEKVRGAAGERAEKGIRLWARVRAALEEGPDDAPGSSGAAS